MDGDLIVEAPRGHEAAEQQVEDRVARAHVETVAADMKYDVITRNDSKAVVERSSLVQERLFTSAAESH